MDRTLGRLFRAVCAGEPVESSAAVLASACTSPQMVRDIVDAALYHRIVPLLAEALRDSSASGSLFEETMRVYREQASHVLRLEALLNSAVTALSKAGIASAVFKGPALAHCYYASPAQRTYVDIDLLVSRENMGRANEALRSAGLQSTGVDWQEAVDTGYGEVTYLGKNQTTLDLHWHPIREPVIRTVFNWATPDLLSRATIAHVAGIELPVLDPEDMLIAVATHACYDGAYRLGWFVDVARIEQSGLVRWDVLAQRCESTGVGLPVQVVMDRARRTLGYSPDGPHSYARGLWRTLTATLGTIRPVEHTFGQAGRGGIIFRSTRQTSGASIAALATLTLDEVAKPFLTNPSHRWKRPRRQRDRVSVRP